MGRVRVLEDLPLSDVPRSAGEFLHFLGGPALLVVRGRDPSRVRAVATLLHGNEPSGTRAVHRWLLSGQTPPTSVAVFFGAVEAALAPPLFGHRALPGRPDLNRCFVPPCEGDEPELAREALSLLDRLRPEALVDIHNTSGESLPFSLGPVLDDPHLSIGASFCSRYIWSDVKIGALVEATHADYPSVVVECGRFGDPLSDEIAYLGLLRYLAATPQALAAPLEVLRSPVRIYLRPGLTLGLGARPQPGADLTLLRRLDRFNFRSLGPGTPIGWARDGVWPLLAQGADGRDVSRELFEERDGRLVVKSPLTPAMATVDARAAGSDCLFYAVFPAEPSASRTQGSSSTNGLEKSSLGRLK